MVKSFLLTVLLSFFVIVLNCATKDNNPFSETEHINLVPSVIWKSASSISEPLDIDSVSFAVYSSSGQFTDTVKGTFPYLNHKGTLSVPKGYQLQLRVQGLNANGYVLYTGLVTIADLSTDPLIVTIVATQITPIVPTPMTIAALSSCTYKISWKDNSSNESGFKIYHKNSIGSFDSVGVVPADSCSFIHRGVAFSTYQIYRVAAFNTSGLSKALTDSVLTPAQATSNKPPQFLIDSTMIPSVIYLDKSISIRLLAFDPNCDSYTFTTSSPLSITNNDVILWTPKVVNLGKNHFTAYATDHLGTSDTLSWVWDVRDTIRPRVSLIGKDTMYLSFNDRYLEPGVIAYDNVHGDISSQIVVTGEVKTGNFGTYLLKYTVKDSSQNTSDTVCRTILVYSGTINDQTPPVIKLIGKDSMTVEGGSAFLDPGAIAIDNHDDTITSRIIVTDSVIITKTGTYSVRYNVQDAAKNPAIEKIRYVTVTDSQLPVVTLIGPETLYVEIDSAYIDPGAKALDNFDGDITSQLQISSNINTKASGVYWMTYLVADLHKNTAFKTRTVIVADRTPPIIALHGTDSVYIAIGGAYLDKGVTATDNHDGDLSIKIKTTGLIITTKLGSNYLYYNVSDSAGNAATQMVRTIIVIDTTKPKITLVGPDTIRVSVFNSFVNPGAKANDEYDGNLDAKVTITGNVDTSKISTYKLTYSVVDFSNNAASIDRYVTVFDSTPPVIKLTGPVIMKIPVFSHFVDSGATAFDNYDQNISDSIKTTGKVDTSIVGANTITYRVADQSKNNASIDRIINVYDNLPPVIEIVGGDTLKISLNAIFKDPTVKVTDNYDKSVEIKSSGTVDTSVAATYKRQYNAKDSSGNSAIEKVLTVIVK